MTVRATNAGPLCVDLDGTLIRSDLLKDSLWELASRRAWLLPSLALYLAKGRAAFKQRVAAISRIDVAALAFHVTLLEMLGAERARGRPLLLVTGSDRLDAERVASHLEIFDEVIASDGRRNVTGQTKAEILCTRFGERNFDYAGNSWIDLPIWRVARRSWIVSRDPRLIDAVRRITHVEHVLAWS